MIDLEAPGSEYKKVSLETVLAMLEEQKEYSYVFEYTVDAEKRRKKMTYQYLDQTRSRILFLMSDITEETRQEREHTETLQQALKEVRHADAMKTDFLSNLSHDMRTPLNAVLGYTSLAKTSFDTSDNREYLDKIEQAGKIMLDLVNDTLDLSKIESGAIMLKPVPTYYDEVIKKVSSAIKPLADEKHIDFTLDDEHAARVPFMVDPLRLQEVLMNLLSNAIKFTPENGTVIMTVECTKIEEDYICDVVKVKDNGCGMDAEFIPKMFEPFSQERQKSDTPGSGLGLSIVQKLITMMHGQIEVNSQIGKGTEFIISLKFERADGITDRSNQPARDWSSLVGRKVLLAEDNEMNIEVAKALLEMKGMVVTVAENGQIACQMFEDSEVGAFDVILMDIRMPVMVMTTVCISITRRLLKIDRYGLMQNPMDNIAINEESIEVDEIEEISVGEATQKGHDKRGKVDTMTIKILVSVVLGMISGYLFVDDLFSSFDVFNTFASLAIKLGLCTLLVFVGMDLGLDGKVVDNFKKVGIRIMAIPLAAIVGTLIGSALCGIFLPVSMKESLAIGAGFGWYSLAPGIIMDKGYVIAGAISFMHNVMRELLAIITIPMVAKHVGFVECCGLPGASAMDVCLPIVERATSSNTAVYSFVSGVVLSIAVPIMVPLIIG